MEGESKSFLGSTPGDWARSARNLLYVAMAVFLVTIAIGIINGLDLYEFNRDQLLTHVHSGTMGWLTLGIVGGTIWLAKSVDRRLALALRPTATSSARMPGRWSSATSYWPRWA